ncbi:Sphingosine N-acyltransferase [Penicillium canescens]|nr:Sphingosine N-acyltransferase [Penicillium canescens]
MREMFSDWLTRELSGITKTYILGQWAFWLQQVIVINIKERRKDHWQMLAHHIVAIVLISTLALNTYRQLDHGIDGCGRYFLPHKFAKCLKYLGFSTLCDTMFGVFMFSWFLARHVFYMITMWSIWTHMAEIIPTGCYHGSQDNLAGPTPLPEHGWSYMLDPFRNPSGTICYSDNVRWGFLGALGFLQVLTVFWFFLIIQVAIHVIRGIGADDIRSDDDGEGEEEDLEYEDAQPLEVDVEAIGLKGWNRRAGVKRTARSSGVSLLSHRDRKALLSRIGCETQVD